MAEFKGFEDWVDVFEGGPQKDMNGKVHDGDQLIDKALASFDPNFHEPPAVVGHPKNDAPAYGWVEKIQAATRNGKKILQAKFRQVVPEFADLVKDGRFKKRSASFYPDGRLRHVGFLGASPPAVKGLADMKFLEDDSTTFEFGEGADMGHELGVIARLFLRLRDWIVEKDGAQAAEKVIDVWDLNALQREAALEQVKTNHQSPSYAEGEKEQEMDHPRQVKDAPPMFSEADMEAKIKEAKEAAAKEAREALQAEFAEKAAHARAEARSKEIAEFVEAKIKAGKALPAWKKAGLIQFMEGLEAEEPVQFSEGEKGRKNPLDWFKEFVESLPKIIDFSEVAGRDGVLDSPATAADKLEALTREKMKGNQNLDYGTAFAEVSAEHPALAAEYAQEL